MTTEIATTTNETRPAFLAPLLNRNGERVGTQASFVGRRTPKEIKELLASRWPDLKGNKLSAKVREIMRGRSTLSEQLMQASLVELRTEAEKRGKTVVWEGLSSNFKTGKVRVNAIVIAPEKTKGDKSLLESAEPAPSPTLEEQVDTLTEEQAMALVAKLSAKFGA